MPASNSTVLPASGLASSARQASAMRLASSGGDQRSHIPRGALPYIAPPSSFCELPVIDQSLMARILSLRCLERRRLADRVARVGAALERAGGAIPGDRLQ